MQVNELEPGMVFLGIRTAGNPLLRETVICTVEHPVYQGFTLVVWKMSDGTMSFDALSPHQELPVEWIGQNRGEMQAAWCEAIGLKRG